MAPVHQWRQDETAALIQHLLQGCEILDMRNPKELGYFVVAVAATLFASMNANIIPEDVVREFMRLEERHHSLKVRGAFYKVYKDEPRFMGILSRGGEPNYIEIRWILEEYRADGWQWAWLLQEFKRGPTCWIMDEVPNCGRRPRREGFGGRC